MTKEEKEKDNTIGIIIGIIVFILFIMVCLYFYFLNRPKYGGKIYFENGVNVSNMDLRRLGEII